MTTYVEFVLSGQIRSIHCVSGTVSCLFIIQYHHCLAFSNFQRWLAESVTPATFYGNWNFRDILLVISLLLGLMSAQKITVMIGYQVAWPHLWKSWPFWESSIKIESRRILGSLAIYIRNLKTWFPHSVRIVGVSWMNLKRTSISFIFRSFQNFWNHQKSWRST